jgi:hypothetical protein
LSSYSPLPSQPSNIIPSFPGLGAIHLQLLHDGPEILHLLHLPAHLRKPHGHPPVRSDMGHGKGNGSQQAASVALTDLTNIEPIKPQSTYSCPFCRKVRQAKLSLVVRVGSVGWMCLHTWSGPPCLNSSLKHNTTRYVRPSSTTPTTTTATCPAATRYVLYYISTPRFDQPRSLPYFH